MTRYKARVLRVTHSEEEGEIETQIFLDEDEQQATRSQTREDILRRPKVYEATKGFPGKELRVEVSELPFVPRT